MKTIIISILFIFFIQVSVFSQNRIAGWDTNKISAVTIEFTCLKHEKVMNTFNESHDIDAIISFLKSVKFNELNSSNLDSLEENHKLSYKISFIGQRDQVYLYKHSACIGKTSFLINKNVIKDFEILVNDLVKQRQ